MNLLNRFREPPPPLPPPATPDDQERITAPLAATDPHAMLDAKETEFLRLINEYRKSKGLRALTPVVTLNTAAASHSLDMGKRKFFSHTNPDGVTPTQRARAAGYSGRVGENIAAGFLYRSASGVFNGWKRSAGHNRNLLGKSYTVIGIGRVEVPGSRYRVYWCIVLGTVPR